MVLQSLWMINSTISKIRQMSKLSRSKERNVFIHLFILKGIFHTIVESTHIYTYYTVKHTRSTHIAIFYLQQGHNILLCLDRNRCYKIYICNPQRSVFLQQQLIRNMKINFYCEMKVEVVWEVKSTLSVLWQD